MRAYVVIFSGATVHDVTNFVNLYPMYFPRWLTVLPQTVFVTSNWNPTEITNFLKQSLSEIDRILVMDAATTRNGWLPESAWRFLNQPG